MKRINYLFIPLFLLLTISCEKESPKTDLEIISEELSSFTNKNNITTCNIVVTNGTNTSVRHTDVKFSINKSFVVVTDQVNGDNYQVSYNLLFLTKYFYSTNKKLELFFTDIQ